MRLGCEDAIRLTLVARQGVSAGPVARTHCRSTVITETTSVTAGYHASAVGGILLVYIQFVNRAVIQCVLVADRHLFLVVTSLPPFQWCR